MSLKFWTTERRISPLPMNNSPLSLEEQKQSLRCLKEVKVESNSNQTHSRAHTPTSTVVKSVYKTKTTATTRYVPRATHIAGGLPQPTSADTDKNNSNRSRRVIFPTLYESKTQSSPLYQNQVRDMPQIATSSLSNYSDNSASGLIVQQGPIKTSSSDEVDNGNVDSGDSTTTSSKHSLDPIHNDDDSIECLMASRRKKNKGGNAPTGAPAVSAAAAAAAIPSSPSPNSSLAGDIVAQLALETFDYDEHNDQPQPPHRYLSLNVNNNIKSASVVEETAIGFSYSTTSSLQSCSSNHSMETPSASPSRSSSNHSLQHPPQPQPICNNTLARAHPHHGNNSMNATLIPPIVSDDSFPESPKHCSPTSTANNIELFKGVRGPQPQAQMLPGPVQVQVVRPRSRLPLPGPSILKKNKPGSNGSLRSFLSTTTTLLETQQQQQQDVSPPVLLLMSGAKNANDEKSSLELKPKSATLSTASPQPSRGPTFIPPSVSEEELANPLANTKCEAIKKESEPLSPIRKSPSDTCVDALRRLRLLDESEREQREQQLRASSSFASSSSSSTTPVDDVKNGVGDANASAATTIANVTGANRNNLETISGYPIGPSSVRNATNISNPNAFITRHISHEEMMASKRKIRFDPRVWVHEIQRPKAESANIWYTARELEKFKTDAVQRIRKWTLKNSRKSSFSPNMIGTGTGRIINTSSSRREDRRRSPITNQQRTSKAFYTNPALTMDADEDEDESASELRQKRNRLAKEQVANILIVDSHDIFLKLLSKGVKSMLPHANITTAYTGLEAMEKIETARIEINAPPLGGRKSSSSSKGIFSTHGFDMIIIENRLKHYKPGQTQYGRDSKNLSNPSMQMSGSSLIQRIIYETKAAMTSTASTSTPNLGEANVSRRYPIVIGMSAYLACDEAQLMASGSDFVWGKPPPKMNEELRDQIVSTLMRKRNIAANGPGFV